MDKKRVQILVAILIVLLSFICMWIHFSIVALILFLVSVTELVLFREVVDTTKEESVSFVEEVEEFEEPEEEYEPEEEEELNFPEGFDEKAFAKSMFLLYRDIQVDFMNFEYESLMSKLGLEMYNQFSKQMRQLENSGRQAVRNNIELQKIQIMSFTQSEDNDTAVVHLSVLEDKYTKKNEEPLRLTSVGVRYESCYALTVVKNYKKNIVKKCNNCNEKLQGNPSICPNCENMLQECVDSWILKNLKLVASKSYSTTEKES